MSCSSSSVYRTLVEADGSSMNKQWFEFELTLYNIHRPETRRRWHNDFFTQNEKILVYREDFILIFSYAVTGYSLYTVDVHNSYVLTGYSLYTVDVHNSYALYWLQSVHCWCAQVLCTYWLQPVHCSCAQLLCTYWLQPVNCWCAQLLCTHLLQPVHCWCAQLCKVTECLFINLVTFKTYSRVVVSVIFYLKKYS